jgi:hypothetical protein
MAGIWFVIVLLNASAGTRSTNLVAAIPREQIPSSQILIASLRENRRLLMEMIAPETAGAETRPSTFPQPRSERRIELLIG